VLEVVRRGRAVGQAVEAAAKKGASSSEAVEILDSSDEETAAIAAASKTRATKEPTPLFRAETPQADWPGSDGSAAEDDVKAAVESSPSRKSKVEDVFLRRNDFRSSTKLDALVTHLNAVREAEENFHVVVFSQFTSFRESVVRLRGRRANRAQSISAKRSWSESGSSALAFLSN
jgi:hypothetical protein